jgi:hypothetical protein
MNKYNRRQFLTAATAAVVAPMILPSRLFGKDAPSNKITLAAIGCGVRGYGNVLHNGVKAVPDMRLVAACDCFKIKREKMAADVNKFYGGNMCSAVADFREVLARKDIDGVIISTPDHWHVPLAYYAAQAGKDVYLEKPLGVAMAWAWKLRELMNQKKTVFQYGTQQRSSKEFRRVCELVRNNYLGKIKHVDVWCPDMSSQFAQAKKPPYGDSAPAPLPKDFDYETWIGPAPMKPYTADRCTNFGAYHIYDYALGFIAGWGAHPLDIAQWGLGTDHTGPVRYEGKGVIPPAGSLWDSVESWDINCTYADGITMRFMSERVAKPVVEKMGRLRPWGEHGTTFFGDKDWISVNRGAVYASRKELQRLKIKDTEPALYQSTANHMGNFVECIKSRQPTISPLESAIRSDTISHLSDQCVRLGRSIQWDPEKEQIVGEPDTAKLLNRPMREPWML